jgi:hypothetical protein
VLISHSDRSTLVWPLISAYAYQCPICSGMKSQAYQWNGLYHETRRKRQRLNVLKYIYSTLNSRQQLTPNSRQQLTRNGEAHLVAHSRAYLAAHGEAHITRNSRAHIGSSSRAHIMAHSRAHLVRNSRAHLARNSRAHLAAHRIRPVSVGNRAQQLGSPNCCGITPVGEQNWHATSRLHLRSPPVGYI